MTENVNSHYVALLGDAVASRDLAPGERAGLQQRLRTVLAEVNRRWRKVLAARFAIALGDQFEGLLTDPAAIWDIAHFVRAELDEVDWIIAGARGRITTPLGGAAPEVDGPVFHRAREALAGAKQRRLVFTLADFPEPASGLAEYYSAMYWSWTDRQRKTAALLRLMDPAAAAERLGVGRSAVSHLMRRLGWDLVASGDAAFRRVLEGDRS